MLYNINIIIYSACAVYVHTNMEELRETASAEFLEQSIFPVLLPGLEATLKTAKHTERRKRFNPLDYLSAYLFRNNPNKVNRADVSFEDIPFVKEKWNFEPHPALPLSATLTEDEAATIIQAHFRGYHVRSKNLHVVEFRKWQKRYTSERIAVRKIQRWWRRLLSDGKLSRVVARESAHGMGTIEEESEESEGEEEEEENGGRSRQERFVDDEWMSRQSSGDGAESEQSSPEN